MQRFNLLLERCSPEPNGRRSWSTPLGSLQHGLYLLGIRVLRSKPGADVVWVSTGELPSAGVFCLAPGVPHGWHGVCVHYIQSPCTQLRSPILIQLGPGCHQTHFTKHDWRRRVHDDGGCQGTAMPGSTHSWVDCWMWWISRLLTYPSPAGGGGQDRCECPAGEHAIEG